MTCVHRAVISMLLLAAASSGAGLQPPPIQAASLPTVASLPSSLVPPAAGRGVPRGGGLLDVAAHGYVEEEFLVTGKGNVYQYDPTGGLNVKTPDMAYTTRILVR